MCGLAGILDFKGRSIEKSLLKAMCDTMVHRGPDDEGYYFKNDPSISIALGHRRLSIIDLKTGHQPIYNEKKDICVVNNGEIYNFRDLRETLEKKGHVFSTKSDTETIVHAYEEYGEGFVKHLRGMFAIALWDERESKLILVRDRLGKKPLLYSYLNKKLIFASTLKAIAKHPEIDKSIDCEAIHHYLTYLCIPSPFTIFTSVRKIPAAHMLICKNGKLELKRYWNIDFSKKIKIEQKEAIKEIERLIEDAVRMRLVSDVPLGILLSGGVDSSCVTAFANRLNHGKLRTFSIGFGEHEFNELPYAELIAKNFSTDHNTECVSPNIEAILPGLVEYYGEPFADSSALPSYFVCRSASKYVKVVLNGDGGDEVFAGYRRHLASYLAESFTPIAKAVNRSPIKLFFNAFPDRPSRPNSPGSIRRFLDASELDRANRYMRWIGFFNEEFKRGFYTEDFRNKTRSFDSNALLDSFFKEARDLDSIDAALFVDTSFGLHNDLLVKMDIASMSNSLETRSPLLDQDLMEFSASLPSSLKIKNFTLKYIFKKTLRDIVPAKILERPKRGFAVPVDNWFRGPLKNYLSSNILSSKALKRGYFKKEALHQIVEDHVRGRSDYGQHLWGLLVLELWHKRFMDGAS